MTGLALPSTIEVRRDPMLIRRAEAADLPSVVSLLAQMHEEETPEPGNEKVAEAFEEIIRTPGRALLVAAIDGEVAGTLDLVIVPNLSRGGKPWAAIENVVVDGPRRRNGIGGFLLETAVELAESVGCYKLQLVSHAKRDAAHALYRHAGFDAPVSGYRRYL